MSSRLPTWPVKSLWSEGLHRDASNPEKQRAEEGYQEPSPQHELQVVALTPTATPRAAEGVQQDLLQEFDPLQQWWDATAPQGEQNTNVLPLPLGPPMVLAPRGGTLQPVAGQEMSAGMPPGLGLTTADAVGNFAGRRPEGPIQATHPQHGGGSQRGDVNPVPAPTLDSMRPDVTTASLMNLPAVGHDEQHGVLGQRYSDIFDFLRGHGRAHQQDQSSCWAGLRVQGGRARRAQPCFKPLRLAAEQLWEEFPRETCSGL